MKQVLALLAVSALAACRGGDGGSGDTDPGTDPGTGPDPGPIVNVTPPIPMARNLMPALNQSNANFESDHFSAVRDQTRDVGIGRAWETSTMANSARDPYWHAVVASELHQYPMLEEEINDTCTRCHAPMANEYSRKEGVPLQIFDSGSVDNGDFVRGLLSSEAGDPLYDHGMDGVSCTLCHQIDPGNLGTEQSMTGGYTIVDYRALELDQRPAYGQYSYRTGGLKEASCQSCHMPVVNEPIKIAAGSTNGLRDNFAEHAFLGANTVMQDMMKNFAAELGIPEGLDFDTSIERNREFLGTAASIEVTGLTLNENTLDFDINVLNETGHKLPSGYHSRRVYLHVEVIDADGEQVFESGRIREDGSIVGVSEDQNPSVWEPHHDVITSPAQVQVYQAIVGNSDGDRTHSLLNGDRYLKDNRLTPQGYDKELINGDPNLPASFGTFGGAELRYQPLSFGHLRKLFTESEEVDQVDMFRTIYDATTLRDEIISTTTSATGQ